MRRRNVSHARYSPSQLVTLESCPGFVSGPSGPAAKRGTEIDAVITALVSGEFVDVPTEFSDQVEFALDAFEQACAVFDTMPEVFPQRFIKTLIPDVHGTADLVLVGLRQGRRHVMVCDYKSGYSDRGEALNHLQINTYGAGELTTDPTIETIELWLIEVDKRFVSKSGVLSRRPFLDDVHARITKVINSVKSATEADWKACNGCRWCVRAVTCPVLEASLKAIEVKDPVEIDDPRKAAEMMSPERVAFFLLKWKAKVETASALVRQVEGRAMAILKAGGDVPGWAIGVGRNTRVWADETAAQKLLMESCGPGVLETALRSPAQVEKLFKEAKPLVKTLTINKPSEKLVQTEGE